ncbi:MAG: hypothetical protein HY204_09630 [Nitrospirae bacterium]|nr:hypothetical protein [Nitrospirota bacterium]
MESRTYPRSKPAVHLRAVAFCLLLTTFGLTLCFLTIPAADSFAQTLNSITVTPANPTITVGQIQQFTATGSFSDGSNRVLSPAMVIAAEDDHTCAVLSDGTVQC